MTLWFKVKNGVRKDDGVTRGSNNPVEKATDGLEHHPSSVQKLLKLTPMVGLLLGAGALMAVHHLFYAYLNEKRVDPGSTELPSVLQSQGNANAIGTTIAHGARILLSMGIAATFMQMFWETLRTRSHSLAQIEALLRCSQSPFHLSSLRAATTSFTLFFVSLAASATSLVVVLSPSSLTTNPKFQRKTPCSVPTVPQEVMAAGNQYGFEDHNPLGSGMQLIYAAQSVLALNSYLPIQNNWFATCVDATQCSHNLSFTGPALDCVDITNETDFTTFLDFNPWYPSIWNASSSSSVITILSRDLEKNSSQANNCTLFNATYEVGVSLQKSTATAQVWSTTLESVLDHSSGNFLSIFGKLAVKELEGICTVGLPAPFDICIYSSFFVTDPSGIPTFGDTVDHFVESYMQNISISLLSGNIYYGYSNDSTTNLDTIQTTCSSAVAIYVYEPAQLLSTYGVAIAVATIIIIFGCSLVWRNGVEQDVLLSDIIRISLNEGMAFPSEDTERRIDDDMQIRLFRAGDSHQKLKFVSPEKISTSTTAVEAPVCPPLSSLMGYFEPARSNMLLFVLSAVVCMILNHAYYHYLDGREPNSSLRLPISSQWALNQSMASDVGVGLAYAGQTLLAVATVTSCAQLFWRAVRQRKHVVSDVDALMKSQASPLNATMLSALQASVVFSLVILCAASMTLISILAPASIKINPTHNQVEDCVVLAPRNLLDFGSNTFTQGMDIGDHLGLISAVLHTGTYPPPINVCGPSSRTSHCTYDLELVGPGFHCVDVTKSSNYTAFANLKGPDTTMIWAANSVVDPFVGTLEMSIQTWDVNRLVYQAVNCTTVYRSYSISISHSTISEINVTNSQIMSELSFNVPHPNFVDTYLQDICFVLNTSVIYSSPTQVPESIGFLGVSPSAIGYLQMNDTESWSPNMALALEEFVQNATLSILSGRVTSWNPNVTDILENVTTSCTYTYTAYEYSPRHLFLTYGIGISVTVLCVVLGSVAISRNGVDETMDFSRLLRAVLNERMFNARNTLDKDSVIKADNTVEGAFAPVDS